MKRQLKKSSNHDIVLESMMILPALVLFLLFVLLPMVGGVFYSVTSWDGLSKTFTFVGAQNYLEIFTNENSIEPLMNTVVYAFFSTLLINTSALLVAVALDRQLKSGNLLRTVYFLPTVLSPLVVGFIFSFIISVPLTDLGKSLGVEVMANNLLGSSSWSLYMGIFVTVWRNMGWYMVIYIAGLQTIPRELYEASDIDGASVFHRFFRITIPLIAPAFTINLVLSVSRAFKEYDMIFALTKGGPGISSTLISMSIYRESFINRRAGFGSALGIVLFVMILLITLVQIYYLRKREKNAEY